MQERQQAQMLTIMQQVNEITNIVEI